MSNQKVQAKALIRFLVIPDSNIILGMTYRDQDVFTEGQVYEAVLVNGELSMAHLGQARGSGEDTSLNWKRDIEGLFITEGFDILKTVQEYWDDKKNEQTSSHI